MKPVVFVSHSGKDAEPSPVDSTDREASERGRRLDYARLVRTEIVTALRQLTDELGAQQLDVWLDKDSLLAGDDWPTELDEILWTCDGAVVLLDSVSVESDWVYKEAMRLSDRKARCPDMLLVPVYLWDFRPEQIETGRWKLIGIDRRQGVRLDRDGGSAADARELAKLVVQRFRGLSRPDDETPVGRWVADVAALLGIRTDTPCAIGSEHARARS